MTPDDLMSFLEKTESFFSDRSQEIEVKGVKHLEEIFKDRIFKKGLNTDNSKIGKYSKWWAGERMSRGLQVNYVDLKFTGELEESIKTWVDKGQETLLVIWDSENLHKANYQEYLQGDKSGLSSDMKIFTVSADEQKNTEKFVTEVINEQWDILLNYFV